MSAQRWSRLRCSRCAYTQEQPGVVDGAALDAPCRLCGAALGAATVYVVRAAISEVRACASHEERA